jgi:hypothetical protein
LTSSNDAVTTPRGSVSSNNTVMEHDVMHIQSQIEELLRYNESQRSLLQDLSLAFQHRKATNIAPEPR